MLRGILVPEGTENLEELPRRAMLARCFSGGYSSLANRVAITETWLRLGRVGLALEEYRAAHGSYPDSLADLGLGGEVLRDVFSDGEFKYKPSGSSVLLYSLGLDRIDGGGEAMVKLAGDIVWKISRDASKRK